MSIIEAYVTNLGKYNEGELVGKWIELPIGEEDFKEVLKEIGVDGENYKEYFFTDYSYDNIENLYLSEHENIDDLNEIAEQLENLSDYELDVFNAITQYFGVGYALEFNIDDYNLYTDITNEEDLGRYYADEVYFDDIKTGSILHNYIDYEQFGHDIALEADGGFTDYGFIERVQLKNYTLNFFNLLSIQFHLKLLH